PGGADTSMFLVSHGRERRALRVFAVGEGERARREVEAMRLASAGGIPTPSVPAEAEVHGRPCLVAQWLDGSTVVDALGAGVSDAAALGAAVGEAQARLRRVAVPPTSVLRRRDWIAWMGSDDLDLAAELSRRASGGRLLHLDLHPMNVLVNDTGAVTGVLDWANAAAGDPRADFARTYSILHLDPHVELHPELSHSRRRFADAWEGACRATDWDDEDLAVFFVWAGAVMVADLLPRIRRGAAPFGEDSLDPVRKWAARWRRRCGLGPAAV
ncbi:MAG: phosphotransferase family protein, partial [Actinomycetota bacterium]